MYDVSRNIKITIGHNAMSSAPKGIIFNITFFFFLQIDLVTPIRRSPWWTPIFSD